ncbi:hypothetical protein D3C86_1539000 [compost metagenome]
MMVTLARLPSFFCNTASARSLSSNSIRVTWATMPARSMAASTPELPPPMTATRLPWNRGPSQWGQKVTPLVRYSASPGTPISRQRAPVAITTVRALRVAPLASRTWWTPSPGMSASARWTGMMSTPYSRTCCSIATASCGPSVCFTEMKFSMARVSSTCPPKRSATTPVRMPLRAA